MTDVAGGEIVSVTKLNDKAGTLIKYLERPTASSAFTTTEIPILRGDDIAFVVGRAYEIVATPTVFGSSVAGDLIEMKARVNLAGAATITSTHIGSLVTDAKTSGGSQKVRGATWLYIPGSTALGSLLVSGIRTGGSGNCTIGTTISAYMLRVTVKDVGEAVADAGVDL